MPELRKVDNVEVGVTVDGKPLIEAKDGILYESISNKEALLYLEDKEKKHNIKIKILNIVRELEK